MTSATAMIAASLSTWLAVVPACTSSTICPSSRGATSPNAAETHCSPSMTMNALRCRLKTSRRYARTCRRSATGSVVSSSGTSSASDVLIAHLLAGDECAVRRDLVEHLPVPANGDHRAVDHERHPVGDVEDKRTARCHERRPPGARAREPSGDPRLCVGINRGGGLDHQEDL